MELYSLGLIILWLIPLWLLGWLILPSVRHVFPSLPDGGLAAGRLLFVALVAMSAFWAASLRLLPLSLIPWLMVGLPLLICNFSLSRATQRAEFAEWLSHRKRNLLACDLVFVAAFVFFVLLRLFQPEIQGQEKPMDSAIIGVLARSEYLPAENPWFGGTSFTNYYYFGHLMSALLARTFQTPLPYAYNLIQPVFCAFFVSILFSLCAALTRSNRLGAVAVFLIAVAGNYEPLRQWASAWREGTAFWPLDWWSTSRVVPFTINEYPFFTLALGDAHAHFFALSLSALLLCLCYSGMHTAQRLKVLLLTGVCLGALLMTNSWNVPAALLLAAVCLGWREVDRSLCRKLAVVLIAFAALTALTVASTAPFLLSFEPHVSGWEWALWRPSTSVFLVWGSFLATGIFVVALARTRQMHLYNRSFSDILMVSGVLVLLAPFFFFVHEHLGGEYRHINTVFKFWLQAWIFLGVPLVCLALTGLSQIRIRTFRVLASIAFAAIWIVPVACSASIIDHIYRKSEVVPPYSARFSLNGARFLTPDEQDAISWLSRHAHPQDVVLEAVGEAADGHMIGAYSDFARVSSLSGVSSYLGWPQHAGFWGASANDIHARWQQVRLVYSHGQMPASIGVAYVYFGDAERAVYGFDSLATLRRKHKRVYGNATVELFSPDVSRETSAPFP